MKKILRISLANLKKHSRESVCLAILLLFAVVLFPASVSSISGIREITPSIVKGSGCFKNSLLINQGVYADRYLAFFEEDPRVENYNHTSAVTDVLKIKDYPEEGDAELYDISFVPESGERRMEDFQTDADFASAEHPIVLDSSNEAKLGVSVGDEITVCRENKEFTFTVVGFYESGLWDLGTKAVVSDEDFANLEDYMDRYEVIGIDTVEGTDDGALLDEFKSFVEENSLNDVSTAIYCLPYANVVSVNNTNMSLLSVIIAIMATVIVVAIMIMIRFRIASDIKEQIVSIGVLEALGYTSGQIVAAYILEYVLIALVSLVIGILPTYFITLGLLKNAASSVHYGGQVEMPVLPIVFCMIAILIFVAIVAMSRALSVRKYPPVLAFRKGIETHSFKKTVLSLEKAKGNIHIRLAMKEVLQGTKNQIGFSVCIMACTIMVLLSFMIGFFFADTDRILGSVCGHELCDIRIEAVGETDPEAFAKELSAMPEVEQVLIPAVGLGVKAGEKGISMNLEVYDDYAKTSTIILTEGRLPEHENEAALSVQAMKQIGVDVGDTMTLESGKVKRDYILTGCVNSAVEPVTAYLTTPGFKRMNPAYTPSTFDIYLKEDADKEAVADILKERYGREIAEYKDAEVTGDTLEERIRSAADIQMAKAMSESGVSYMEYAIRVGDRLITGSTSTMKIEKLTFVYEENKSIAGMLCVSFASIAVIMMIISAIVVVLMLSILMASTIRRQYRELGIMKGMGYTSRELMFQMAFRIVPVTTIAVAAGTGISILLMGVVDTYVAKIPISLPVILVTDLVILVFCFICAFICARRIKKISVYELITE